MRLTVLYKGLDSSHHKGEKEALLDLNICVTFYPGSCCHFRVALRSLRRSQNSLQHVCAARLFPYRLYFWSRVQLISQYGGEYNFSLRFNSNFTFINKQGGLPGGPVFKKNLYSNYSKDADSIPGQELRSQGCIQQLNPLEGGPHAAAEDLMCCS